MDRERESLWARLRRGLVRLLPPATPQPETRESVWSVSQRDATTFFRLLSLLWLVGLAYVAYRAPYPDTADSAPFWTRAGDYIIGVLAEFGLVAVGIAIIALLITRPLNLIGELLMSLYQAMVNRYVTPVIERHREEGREEGRVEGREEGRVEGREEGREERDVQWQGWLQRRADAESKGQPFDEPPPGAVPSDSE